MRRARGVKAMALGAARALGAAKALGAKGKVLGAKVKVLGPKVLGAKEVHRARAHGAKVLGTKLEAHGARVNLQRQWQLARQVKPPHLALLRLPCQTAQALGLLAKVLGAMVLGAKAPGAKAAGAKAPGAKAMAQELGAKAMERTARVHGAKVLGAKEQVEPTEMAHGTRPNLQQLWHLARRVKPRHLAILPNPTLLQQTRILTKQPAMLGGKVLGAKELMAKVRGAKEPPDGAKVLGAKEHQARARGAKVLGVKEHRARAPGAKVLGVNLEPAHGVRGNLQRPWQLARRGKPLHLAILPKPTLLQRQRLRLQNLTKQPAMLGAKVLGAKELAREHGRKVLGAKEHRARARGAKVLGHRARAHGARVLGAKLEARGARGNLQRPWQLAQQVKPPHLAFLQLPQQMEQVLGLLAKQPVVLGAKVLGAKVLGARELGRARGAKVLGRARAHGAKVLGVEPLGPAHGARHNLQRPWQLAWQVKPRHLALLRLPTQMAQAALGLLAKVLGAKVLGAKAKVPGAKGMEHTANVLGAHGAKVLGANLEPLEPGRGARGKLQQPWQRARRVKPRHLALLRLPWPHLEPVPGATALGAKALGAKAVGAKAPGAKVLGAKAMVRGAKVLGALAPLALRAPARHPWP